MNITLSPAAIHFMRVATDLNEAMDNGTDTMEHANAYSAAYGALEDEGRTLREIDALMEMAS